MPDPSDPVLRLILGDDPPARLDKALARDVPEDAALSRSRLSRMIDDGAVSRAGLVLDAKARVAAGDVIDIRLDPPESVETLAEDIPLAVVYEDADLIVIDKPAGMVVHPAVGSPRGTLVNALLHHCGESLSGIGSTRKPRACWWSRNPTAPIMGWRPSSRLIPSTAITLRWSTACRMPPPPGCAASRASGSKPAAWS
jgi:hypothetical protein